MPEPLNLKQNSQEKEKKEEKDLKATPKKSKEIQKSPEKTPEQINWSAPEFTKYQKDKIWLLVPGVLLTMVFLFAIFTKSFLFAIIVVLSYFLVLVYAFKKPEEVNITIDSRGIKINNLLYEYDNLSSFWIFYEPPEIKELSLRVKKKTMPYVTVPLGKINPAEVRRILVRYLPEKKHKESLIDHLARFFRF